MSRRLVVAIPEEHFTWLDEVRAKMGLENVQDAARTIIADCYSQDKRKPKPNRKKTKPEVSGEGDDSALD